MKIIVALILAFSLGLAGCTFTFPGVEPYNPPTPLPKISQEKQEPRALDGVLVEATEKDPLVAAVIIDNMVEGQPPAGLARASLVFEAPVEAEITRLLAFYPFSSEVKKIGPIRSLRPYFLSWAEEMADILAHVGGSPEALKLAKKSPVFNLDEFTHTSSFWRDEARKAPHNVYTFPNHLSDAYIARPELRKIIYLPWQYSEEIPVLFKNAPEAKEIIIPFDETDQQVVWRFSQETKRYDRSQGGAYHRDEDGLVIQADNIAVMKTKIKILDEVGRREIATKGKGQAFLFRDGKVVEGKWEKQEGGRTRFFDAQDQEIQFRPGITWIEVVPLDLKISY